MNKGERKGGGRGRKGSRGQKRIGRGKRRDRSVHSTSLDSLTCVRVLGTETTKFPEILSWNDKHENDSEWENAHNIPATSHCIVSQTTYVPYFDIIIIVNR